MAVEGSDDLSGPDGAAETTRSSSTPGLIDRLGGLIRIVHPFPSLLDALVTGTLALVAGGGWALAVRLAVSMFALQGAIGTANDLVDEPVDRARQARQAPAVGLVSRRPRPGLLRRAGRGGPWAGGHFGAASSLAWPR